MRRTRFQQGSLQVVDRSGGLGLHCQGIGSDATDASAVGVLIPNRSPMQCDSDTFGSFSIS